MKKIIPNRWNNWSTYFDTKRYKHSYSSSPADVSEIQPSAENFLVKSRVGVLTLSSQPPQKEIDHSLQRHSEYSGKKRKVHHSGIQLTILTLYRSFLRLAYRKSDSSSREALLNHIRHQFRYNANISKRDFVRIENLIHRANRQLDSLKNCSRNDNVFFYKPECPGM